MPDCVPIYAPTTQHIRDRVRHSHAIDNPGMDGEAMFERWLAAHDAAVRREARAQMLTHTAEDCQFARDGARPDDTDGVSR